MNNRRFIYGIATLLVIIGQFWCLTAFGQQSNRIVQLSGIILGEDSVSFVPGAHIYVPKAGRGTTSNSLGFFSLPVLVGDSVVISSVGYEPQYYVIPQEAKEYTTVIVTMVESVTYLREITVVPFPTEEIFKEAVLALNVPIENGVDEKNLNEQLLALMMRTTPYDGQTNQSIALDQWARNQGMKNQFVANPLLNPFNWAKFFQSLKKKK